MKSIRAIPSKRKVIVEKIEKHNSSKSLFLLEFSGKNITEQVIVKIKIGLRTIIDRVPINDSYQVGVRVSWKPMTMYIEESVGQNNAESFCRWITDSSSDHKKYRPAKIIHLKRLYDGCVPTGEEWILYGAVVKSVSTKKRIRLTLDFNNCRIGHGNDG